MPELVYFFMEHWNMQCNFDDILHAYAVQLFAGAVQLFMSDLIFQEKDVSFANFCYSAKFFSCRVLCIPSCSFHVF